MSRRRRPRPVRYCEICGGPIENKAGYPALTCSPECRKTRNNEREKARYKLVKDTPQWSEVRANYLDRLRRRAANDPEFASTQAARHRAAVARYTQAVRQDPEKLAVYRERKARWFQGLPPDRRETERERNRAWYAQLTREEKILHYYETRRQRALERLVALGDALNKRKNS